MVVFLYEIKSAWNRMTSYDRVLDTVLLCILLSRDAALIVLATALSIPRVSYRAYLSLITHVVIVMHDLLPPPRV